jgi:hypothetical protein
LLRNGPDRRRVAAHEVTRGKDSILFWPLDGKGKWRNEGIWGKRRSRGRTQKLDPALGYVYAARCQE